MIIRNNKGFETNSHFPNVDWYDDGRTRFVLEDGSDIAEKVKQHAPYYDFVEDEAGNLTDITPWPDLPYTIDKTTFAPGEVVIIDFGISVTAATLFTDGQSWIITDGSIEYSNENLGVHVLRIEAEGCRPVEIIVEVI